MNVYERAITDSLHAPARPSVVLTPERVAALQFAVRFLTARGYASKVRVLAEILVEARGEAR